MLLVEPVMTPGNAKSNAVKRRVLLVDDHTFVRDGLAGLLHGRLGFEVVGEAYSVKSAIEALEKLKPDLVVIDLRLPDGSGIQVLESAKKMRWGTYAVVLSAFKNEDDLVAAARAGARAFLIKSELGHEVLDKLLRVMNGEDLIESEIPVHLRRKLQEKGLTPQEMEMLRFLAQGLTNNEICTETGLKPNTVKTHLRNLFSKIGVSNRTQAASLASRRGFNG